MRVRSLCVMLALLAACGKQERAAPARIETRVRLARAATCESLTRQVQDTAARQMRRAEWRAALPRSSFSYSMTTRSRSLNCFEAARSGGGGTSRGPPAARGG